MAGRAGIIARNEFFGVKKVYKEGSGKENKKESQIKKFLVSFAHQHFFKYTKKKIKSQKIKIFILTELLLKKDFCSYVGGKARGPIAKNVLVFHVKEVIETAE